MHQNILIMKNYLLILLLVSFVFSCNKTEPLPPNTYQINGSAKGVYNGIRAYIKAADGPRREIIIDTAIIMNEAFTFKGSVSNSSMQTLVINGVKGNLPFILEPGRINMEIYKDSLSYSTVDGSENNEIYNLYKVENRKKSDAIKKIKLQSREARDTGNTKLYAELASKTNEMNKELNLFSFEFIKEHPDSDFSLLLLANLTKSPNQELEKFKNNLASLKKIINKNESNKSLGQKIEAHVYKLESQKNLEIGKIAPNFTSTTPNGESLSLNDIKGKVTIIEFWAAWCGPCRRENPNIVKVYNKYHEKGLEIIGVSLDGTRRQQDPKAAWLKAVEDDKLIWHHVSSLQYFNDPVAQLYNINSIPASFILDEDGK